MDEDFLLEIGTDLTPTEEEMERWANLEADADIYSSVDRFMHIPG